MTIDPEKFEPQGKPTVEQVKTVWNAHPDPSARNVAALLEKRGFKISYRTVARWHANDWLESGGKGMAAIGRDQHAPAAVQGELRAALDSLPQASVDEANQIRAAGGLQAAIEGGQLKDVDYERIEKRKAELAAMTPAQLLEQQEKARTIMNIVIMEEATRKAHVMALIPKDAGSFLSDAADAAKASPVLAPIEPADERGDGSDAKLIQGNAGTELSALSQAIRRVRDQVSA